MKWLNILILLFLTACASNSTTHGMPDEALLQPCPEIPEIEEGATWDKEYLKLRDLYNIQCALPHDKLIEYERKRK